MSSCKFVLLIFFINFFALSVELKAKNPVKCKVGIYISTIKVHQIDEDFDVFFYWWLRVDSIDVNKDYSFVKNLEFINGDVEIEEVVQRVDSVHKYYYVTGTCRGSFPYKSDFKKYPFDKQTLTISIENNATNENELLYSIDDKYAFINKLSDNNIDVLNGGQFYISDLGFKQSIYSYRSNFGDPKVNLFDNYSRLSFNISVSHNAFDVLQKIALPLLIVLILAYSVFYIPDYEIGTASALTVTSLLAAIAFQWTIYDSLPKVSYITLMDKIFYLVYFFIFYSMSQTVLTFNLSKGSERQIQLSNRLEFHSRYLFPIIFIVSLWLIMKL